MTNDDNQSDQFIREVDEELRREQLKSIWDRYGSYVIATCILIVAITAGYRGWGWWQDREAARQGDVFLEAVNAQARGEVSEADALFADLLEGGRGYALLAKLQLAGALSEAGKSDEAIAAYDEIADTAGADEVTRDLAKLKAALLLLDAGDGTAAVSKVEGLAESGNPWRHAARDILGTIAYNQNRLDDARGYFQSIQSDVESPGSARGRAAIMLSLIDGKSLPGQTGDDTQSPD